MKIGIAGCGIGGLSAAIFLARQGHTITIFDQFENPAPVGSGLIIQPVGQTCLEALGVLDQLRLRGRKIWRMEGKESRTGRTVLGVNYGTERTGIFGLSLHRSELFNILSEAAIQAGAKVRSNITIIQTECDQKGRLLFADDGQSYGPFDLVIDATGARSVLSPIRRSALPYGALWGNVDWPHDSPLPQDRLSQCYNGAHHMLGVLAIGKAQGRDEPQASIFWSEPAEKLSHWEEQSLDRWKAMTIRLWPEFEPFIKQIRSHDQMRIARYSHGTLSNPYEDRLVFIGDAAHQASPQLGQGANMALLDATCLSQALATEAVADALKTYARKRRLHVRTYQAVSAIFTPFYQSKSRILPPIRNHIFHPISQLWPIDQGLTKLVCGDWVPTGVRAISLPQERL